MLSLELCRALKEAGFEQNGDSDWFYFRTTNGKSYFDGRDFQDGQARKLAYIPLLEELIEALPVKKRGFTLTYRGRANRWEAELHFLVRSPPHPNELNLFRVGMEPVAQTVTPRRSRRIYNYVTRRFFTSFRTTKVENAIYATGSMTSSEAVARLYLALKEAKLEVKR